MASGNFMESMHEALVRALANTLILANTAVRVNAGDKGNKMFVPDQLGEVADYTRKYYPPLVILKYFMPLW